MVKVTNRSRGSVVYKLPELNVRREFYPQETKTIAKSEIEQLTAQPGGRELLYNYLFIEDKEVIKDVINVEPEPEYWLTEENIPNWMQTSSLDEFKDGLDFAPDGIKDLIKKYAVELPLNDVSKRKAMLDQLNFNVDVAVESLKPDPDSEGEVVPASANKRRAAKLPTYNVVSRSGKK